MRHSTDSMGSGTNSIGPSDQTVSDLLARVRHSIRMRDEVAAAVRAVRQKLEIGATANAAFGGSRPRLRVLVGLERLRTERGWSRQELARRSGLAAATILRLENGRRAQME